MTHGLQSAQPLTGTIAASASALKDATKVVGALIDTPDGRRINFTGSTAGGKIVARRAAENLKPVLLELNGKALLSVLEDADLDEAVKAAAFGAFMNHGQICMSTERIITKLGDRDFALEWNPLATPGEQATGILR